MTERDQVEQKQFESKPSTMKKEKKSSKTDYKFKFKLESFKKLPHSSSTNSVFEKARAFFRSFDIKHHHHRHEQIPRHQSVSTHPLCSPSSNEDPQKNDLLINILPSTTNISIPTIPRVEKFNPHDMIVHQIIYNDQQFPSNYFQEKYKKYLKPSLLIPKQYYNTIINKPYSTWINKIDFHSRLPVSTLSSNNTYSTSSNQMSSYYIPRAIEYSPNEQYDQGNSSSSSMLTWNQCVRRLNREYRLTIDALQQAKECLEQIYYNSKSQRETKDLSYNNQTKKLLNVTFCLPSTTISTPSSSSPSPSILNDKIQFSKPKLIKPVELNTFNSSNLFIEENNEKLDSIANIIKKFNDLSNAINQEELITDSSKTKSDIPEISFVTNEENLSEDSLQEEETTYTIETFYKSSDETKNDLILDNQEIIIIQEKTTEEQFNLVHQQVQTNHVSSINNTLSEKITSNNDHKDNRSSKIPAKKSVSHIPKRIIPAPATTNVSRSTPSAVKTISSTSKLKPPSSTVINKPTTSSIKKPSGNHNSIPSSSTNKKQSSIPPNKSLNSTDTTSSNRVKSIVQQLNNAASTNNKRSSRPTSTSTNKTSSTQRK